MPARQNSNPHWLSSLQAGLAGLSEQALLRSLKPVEHDGRFVLVNGKRLLNFASNDYLALASHSGLITRGQQALAEFGAGAGASRLVTGHTKVHAECEAAFAAFKQAEAALLFPTGYMANLAAITALARPDDLILSDKANHASLIDAARLAGAEHRVFPHLGYDKLKRLLHEARADEGAVSAEEGKQTSEQTDKPNDRRILIVTDSVFSMDGDTADLALLSDLAEQYQAILVIDEAHGTGTLGQGGAGLCEALGVTNKNHVVISTASKALGSLGGVVTGPRAVIDTLINQARSFIYTTGIAPVVPAMILESLGVLRDEPERLTRLQALSTQTRRKIDGLGIFPAVMMSGPVTPIVPLVVGGAQAALDLAAHLSARGYYAPAIRPPTVPKDKSRVRLSLRCDFEDEEINGLIEALREYGALK